MLPRGALTVEHVWKRFRADRQRLLLRDEFQRLRSRLRGKSPRGWRWALRDVDFRAEPGDSIGLIGMNGSGKSTLLKILSRVMYPYAGRVSAIGRVGALIEVRAGLHADLTGRENVYLYGSLLGLGRKEVARRFDEIVAFSELEDAVDRQLKFYSTGMQMRLGFAVAAFLEPDVLLVDEVLAVGDASFQQKCLDRMRQVLNQGTTLVYVSHDLPTVAAVCSRGLWLRDGVIERDGPVGDVLASYRRFFEGVGEYQPPPGSTVRLVKTEIVGGNGNGVGWDEPLELRFAIDSEEARSATVYVGLTEGSANPILLCERSTHLEGGTTRFRCLVPRLPLPRGRFSLWMAVLDARRVDLLAWHRVTSFEVAGPQLEVGPPGVVRAASVHVYAKWEVAGR